MNRNRSILSENSVEPDPFRQFKKWYKDRLAEGVPAPDTMSLGTSAKDGQVSVRSVLLKDYNEQGFIFFTNYNSRKGIQLQSNPLAALHFNWPESARQIRIEGIVRKTSPEESDHYFNSRPEDARISAWASDQSAIIPDRNFLDETYSRYRELFNNKSIERPEYWGGYILIPRWFEFWQERSARLHDRISYTLTGDKWIINRLAP
jgi:pyridoxamine 5'-phosphate oxidase